MWRITYLALFVIAAFHFTSLATAQTDNPYEGLFLDCSSFLLFELESGRCEAAKAEAAERGITVEQVFAEAEAAARSISVEELLAEKRAYREAERTKREKERAEAKTRATIVQAVAATVFVAIMVVLIKARRRIGASLSHRWRKRSKDFRVWVFGSFFWVLGVFLYIGLDEPSVLDVIEYAIEDMLGVMIVPPLFFGALWFGYKRFVK